MLTLYYVSLSLAVAGIGMSAYLLDAQMVIESGFCEIGGLLSCSEVLLSPYAYFFGAPTALYGLAWFIVAFMLSLLSIRLTWPRSLLLAWSIVGLLGAAGLTYIELVIINAVCILCTVAHILGAGIFAAAYLARYAA